MRSVSTHPLLHVVLDRPKIAGNVGAIARLVASCGAALHVCQAGFSVGSDLRRPGLDYWGDARVHFHDDLERCLKLLGKEPWVVEVGGEKAPWDAPFARGDVVVLGPEDGSVELPAAFARDDNERILTLPSRPGMRSLNLAQCAAVVVYEGVRQLSL